VLLRANARGAVNPESFRGWTLDVLNIVRRLTDSRRRGNESLTEKSGMKQSLLTSAAIFTTADPAGRDLHSRTGKTPSFFAEENNGNKA
jgi:hypothetical protein